jgi:hypothetical protein
MDPGDAVRRIDTLLSHVWMVRTFLKHSEEASEDEELAEVHRGLYDYMLALGEPLQNGDVPEYLKVARKKLAKLRRTVELFCEIQPEVSTHMNFRMAVQSLQAAVGEIASVLDACADSGSAAAEESGGS